MNTHPDRNHGHHFITWERGKAADMALIQAKISDTKVMDWLLEAGAKPGNNLTEETWTERNDPASAEPDKKVDGFRIRIEIWIDGEKRDAFQLFKDARPGDFEFRFGGHADLIPKWKSG